MEDEKKFVVNELGQQVSQQRFANEEWRKAALDYAAIVDKKVGEMGLLLASFEREYDQWMQARSDNNSK